MFLIHTVAPAICRLATLFGGALLVFSVSAQGNNNDSANITSTSQSTSESISGRSKARSRILEEIIVTAQKREEDVQDVPIAISAFSGDALDARGVYQVTDLGAITPALEFSGFAGYTLIYLRGVGTDAFLPSVEP